MTNEKIDFLKPVLFDYMSGDAIRNATRDELADSVKAALLDYGAGVIEVDGVSCYVD